MFDDSNQRLLAQFRKEMEDHNTRKAKEEQENRRKNPDGKHTYSTARRFYRIQWDWQVAQEYVENRKFL
ncbi:hypothetical protein RvY_07504 [Ramazzottius varieornatus]|uniref:Uncharacterized protein n=1 Tax=Ramazzottius varieornatus TaxID=947166 RepID=A0A1D1VAV8_RAMVA|nr:hypothetical protein RvY_07504 [Ramazzottius varieornatus]